MPNLRRHAWWLPFGCALLALLGGLYVVTSANTQNDFTTTTGTKWATFMDREPSAADYIERLTLLVGVDLLAFALLSALVCVLLLRRGEPAARWLLVPLPLAFAGEAAVFATHGAAGLSGYYAVLAVVAALGILAAPVRAARPGNAGSTGAIGH